MSADTLSRVIREMETLQAAEQGVLYHGSAAPWTVIEKEGLKPHAGVGADVWFAQVTGTHSPDRENVRSRRRSVYCSPQIEIAERFAACAAIANRTTVAYVYTIEPPKEKLRLLLPDEEMHDAVRIEGAVPPQWITSHEQLTGRRLAAAREAFIEANRSIIKYVY